jgi:hypothetical protein
MRWLAAAASVLVLTGCASVGTARSGTAGGPSILVVSPPPAASSPLAVSSPAAASSPVDVGSETPPPIATPSAGSEGTLPPMPPGGRTLDNNDPDSVWMAQNVIDVFAEEVEATAQYDPDYCDVAIDGFHDGMTLWWHGTPSSAVLEVLDRARRAGITPVVLRTPIERRILDAAVDRLSNQMQKLGMSEVSRSTGCSGVDVGLVTDTANGEAAVQAIVGAGIPLHFSEMPDPVAL